MTVVELLLWGKAEKKESHCWFSSRLSARPAVLSLSRSNGLQTQSDSVFFLPVKQLGSVMREHAWYRECCVYVCIWVCERECCAEPACLSINLSCVVPLSVSLPFTHMHSLPWSSIFHCRLQKQSTSLQWPANQSVWEWVMSQQPGPDAEWEDWVVVGGIRGTV